MIRGIISPRREVEAHQVFGQPPGAPGAGLGFQLVDQIHDVEEAAPGPIADDGPCDGNGDVGLARACPADQHDVALLVQELPAREVTHKRLVDRRAVEGELLDLAGDGQLGDGDLVFDRSCLLLVDLGGQQVADHLLRFVLPPDGRGHQFVVGRPHAEELEVGHRGKDLGTLHHPALRSRS